MNRFIFNNEYGVNIVYPITFHSACDLYQQETVKKRTYGFHQILLVLDGKGTLLCNKKSYPLKKGCAFFTSIGTALEYTNDGGLITAFFTARGPAADMLAKSLTEDGLFFTEKADTESYLFLIKNFIDEYKKGADQGNLSALTYSFFVKFISENGSDTPGWLEKAVTYINLNFAEKLTLLDIAQYAYVSVSKLCHEFKKHYSTSVFEYVMDIRLRHAQVLIQDSPNIMTKDVAKECGFYDVGYFCKAYRNKYGKTPSEEKIKYRDVIKKS